tara:strand:+ start:799 stop:1986 length:1188 start_codon:yes stop_codon:yes gene_type:complete
MTVVVLNGLSNSSISSLNYVKANVERVFVDTNETVLILDTRQNQHEFDRVTNYVDKSGSFLINLSLGHDFNYFKKKINKYTQVRSNDLLKNNKNIVISDSEYSHNQTEGNNIIYPFRDDNEIVSIKRKNKVVDIPYNKSLGIENNSDFISFKNQVFKDIDDNITLLINDDSSDTNEYYYPMLFNSFDINSKGSNIDVLGNIEEIQHQSIFGKSIKGLVSNYNSNDVRGRNIKIDNFVDSFNTFNTEHYLEYGEDSLLYSRDAYQKLGKIETTTINNVLSTVYNTNVNDVKLTPDNGLLYFSNDSTSYELLPFYDRENVYFKELEAINKTPRYSISGGLKDHYKNDDSNIDTKVLSSDMYGNSQYRDGLVFSTQGRDFDYSISNGIDSIAYYGELD